MFRLHYSHPLAKKYFTMVYIYIMYKIMCQLWQGLILTELINFVVFVKIITQISVQILQRRQYNSSPLMFCLSQ